MNNADFYKTDTGKETLRANSYDWIQNLIEACKSNDNV